MKNGLLEDGCDPMGQAIRDYYETGRAGRLRVFSPQFDEDEMPVGTLFREEEDMPPLELKALDLCRGRVLDVGAGAGCHSLALQRRGLDVTAVDISPLSVDVMRRRGVRQAWEADVFDELRYGADADERFRHHRAAGTHALVFPSYEATVGTRRLRVGGFQ